MFLHPLTLSLISYPSLYHRTLYLFSYPSSTILSFVYPPTFSSTPLRFLYPLTFSSTPLCFLYPLILHPLSFLSFTFLYSLSPLIPPLPSHTLSTFLSSFILASLLYHPPLPPPSYHSSTPSSFLFPFILFQLSYLSLPSYPFSIKPNANSCFIQAKVRKQVLQTMFFYRASAETSLKRWGSILDENFQLVLPITPYRSFPPAEVNQLRQTHNT